MATHDDKYSDVRQCRKLGAALGRVAAIRAVPELYDAIVSVANAYADSSASGFAELWRARRVALGVVASACVPRVQEAARAAAITPPTMDKAAKAKRRREMVTAAFYSPAARDARRAMVEAARGATP